MGIKQLMNLIKEYAPQSIRRGQLSSYTGRVIVCDAYLAIYQFLIATTQTTQGQLQILRDQSGTPTAHLLGLWNRNIQFLENGIKPVWVFDGKPPELKTGTLAKRRKIKEEAIEKLEQAKEQGDLEEVKRQSQRSVTVTSQMIEDAKLMLKLMGVAVVQAPSEAEAQCAAFVKCQKAFAVASEDMDSLTFGADILLRGFSNKKEPIMELQYKDILQDLQLTHEEFIDMCILCGCDYAQNIDGIGPVTAYKLIKEHHTIENVLFTLEEHNKNTSKKRKYLIPPDYAFEEARRIFQNPEVNTELEIK